MTKRKMSADDRVILDRVIRQIGKQRICQIYLTWSEGAYEYHDAETVDLLHFLNEITRDYSYNAIFRAIDESISAQKRKVKRKVA